MKKLISILTLVFLSQGVQAAEVAPVQVTDQIQIDNILSTYVLFSNKILAKGMAFGFSPAVQTVDISFLDISGDPEMPDCEVTLEATLGAIKNGTVVPVSSEMSKPVQKYTEEGRCEYVKENYIL